MPNNKKRQFTLLPDGTKHFASELEKLFDIAPTTLFRLKKKGKTEFTREELEGMRRGQKFIESPKNTPLTVDDVPYKSTTLERALMSLR